MVVVEVAVVGVVEVGVLSRQGEREEGGVLRPRTYKLDICWPPIQDAVVRLKPEKDKQIETRHLVAVDL